MSLFYRPQDGFLAVVIPFHWNGRYHLFYLKDYRGAGGYPEGTPWFHLVTRDFVHFEDWGEAIPIGAADAQDRWIFTGSVIEKDGEFSAFYTAHNRHLAQKGGRAGHHACRLPRPEDVAQRAGTDGFSRLTAMKSTTGVTRSRFGTTQPRSTGCSSRRGTTTRRFRPGGAA